MKKRLSLILSLFLVIVLSVGVSAEGFLDMPSKSNWAREALDFAVENDFLSGYNGKIRPNDTISRAEMATMISRMLGMTEQANISNFQDLDSSKWYYDHIARTVEAQVLKGMSDYEFAPNEKVTREQAFSAVARIYMIRGNADELDRFKDFKDVSSWSKDELGGLAERGYISGSGGKLEPKKYISRAEMAQILYNINHKIIKSNQENILEGGNVLLAGPNISIRDSIIVGDLIIAEAAKDSTIILDKVDVHGRIIIRNKGETRVINNSSYNSVHFVNESESIFTETDSEDKNQQGLKIRKILDFQPELNLEGDEVYNIPSEYRVLADDNKIYPRSVYWDVAPYELVEGRNLLKGKLDLGENFEKTSEELSLIVNYRPIEEPSNEDMGKEVFELVNKERQKRGLKALKWSSDFKEATDIRAEEISRLFEHVRPDGSSIDSLFVGKNYRGYGENIAAGYMSSEQVMEGWMKSEGHRNNILYSEYDELAVSCYRDSAGRLNWVQIFIIK